MPKQTFFNLSEEKRGRLLLAAYAEFSKVPLEEASINTIIHHSEISRGSFYQYFEDKEDLYFHCLHLLKKDLKNQVEMCFINSGGKLMESLRQTFRLLYEHYFKGDYQDFYHHFFVDMSYRKSRHIFVKEPSEEKKEHPFLVFEDVAKLIDHEELNFVSNDELLDFLQYVFQNIHWTISKVFLQNLSEEEANRIIEQRLSWMEHGILKGNCKEEVTQ